MLDVIGAISLTAGAVALVALLSVSGDPPRWHRRWLPLIAGLWFVVVATLAAARVFSGSPTTGTAALGAAVALPLLAGVTFFARSRHARESLRQLPLSILVAAHAGRLLGFFFLVLLAAGRLPSTFALSAGWGDILISIAAIPVALAIHRKSTGWWWLAAVWNTLGIADLIAALTLGIGSAPDSPLRFLFETPGSAAITALPWVLVPTFFVPLYLLTHLAIFGRLATAAAHGEQPSVVRS